MQACPSNPVCTAEQSIRPHLGHDDFIRQRVAAGTRDDLEVKVEDLSRRYRPPGTINVW